MINNPLPFYNGVGEQCFGIFNSLKRSPFDFLYFETRVWYILLHRTASVRIHVYTADIMLTHII